MRFHSEFVSVIGPIDSTILQQEKHEMDIFIITANICIDDRKLTEQQLKEFRMSTSSKAQRYLNAYNFFNSYHNNGFFRLIIK